MKHVKELLKKYIEADNQILEERDAFVTFQELIDELQEAIEQDEKENGWIPVSERLPESDKYIAILLDNCDIPAIGRYTVDNEGGGTFRVGDQEESFLELDLFVKAWRPLPELYKED